MAFPKHGVSLLTDCEFIHPHNQGCPFRGLVPQGRRYLVPILSPAQPSRRGVRVFIHPAWTNGRPFRRRSICRRSTERPISIPRPPSGAFIIIYRKWVLQYFCCFNTTWNNIFLEYFPCYILRITISNISCRKLYRSYH